MMSYDTNGQVHQTFDLWEKNGSKCVYVGISERFFDVSLIFLVLLCLRCSNKQGNISFDLVGLAMLSKWPINV